MNRLVEPALAFALTEARNPRTLRLDTWDSGTLTAAMHAADREALAAVEAILPAVAEAIDRIAGRLAAGGRLFYQGAGTSGRLGVLDASECPPTYNSPPELVQGIIAGGERALHTSVEGAEDDPAQGAADLAARGFSERDALVGIAASGRTPYVLGGMQHARRLGALTVGLSCVPGSSVEQSADLAITPATGPEVVTGSTRMKAGTATKLVLNMLSTGAMVRLGYVYGNLMVNVQTTNAKLVDRAERIIAEVTGVARPEAAALLAEGGSVRVAIVMHQLGLTREEAEVRLAAAGGRLRGALGQ